MPKIKIRKSIRNRFKITKTGKVLHRSSFGRHLRRRKSKSQIRDYNRDKALEGKIAKKIKRLLGK
ncbi:MAG: 50S ribosomal protein L35 [bacterium]|nr:50S ribosomal protein L35 [bacterium]